MALQALVQQCNGQQCKLKSTLSSRITLPVTTPGEKPPNLLYSSKNQAISRAPVFMSGAGMSSCGPMTSLMDCGKSTSAGQGLHAAQHACGEGATPGGLPCTSQHRARFIRPMWEHR